ncbi:MAG TPA: host attachment protein [Candidatus Wunengus sp. YC61]|uniref:host attachment protein n=1 Tax=Candidatus Wunengus sp. YC61 TaxID=3367698 RepID=UPI0040268179
MSDKRPHLTAPDEAMLHRRWVMVANQAGARIFEGRKGTPLALVQRIDHPEGQMKNSDIDSDQAGRTFDGASGSRHAMEPEVTAHEQVSIRFAKQLAEIAASGRNANKYYELVLVAEPKFLGRIKSNLDSTTLKSVSQTIGKDFARNSDLEVIEHLKNLL